MTAVQMQRAYGALVDATRPSLVFAVAALLSAIGYAALSVAATTRQISVAYVALNACEALVSNRSTLSISRRAAARAKAKVGRSVSNTINVS